MTIGMILKRDMTRDAAMKQDAAIKQDAAMDQDAGQAEKER